MTVEGRRELATRLRSVARRLEENEELAVALVTMKPSEDRVRMRVFGDDNEGKCLALALACFTGLIDDPGVEVEQD